MPSDLEQRAEKVRAEYAAAKARARNEAHRRRWLARQAEINAERNRKYVAYTEAMKRRSGDER